MKAQETPFLEGEIIVALNQSEDANAFTKKMRHTHGVTSLKAARCLSEYMNYWLFDFDPAQIDPYDLKAKIFSQSEVRLVQFNHVVSSRETIPMEEFFGNQWHHVDGSDNDIDSDLAWDLTTGGYTPFGDRIVACIIEGGGTDWDHEDLLENHWVNEHEIPGNGLDDDGNGYVDDYDGWNPESNDDNIPAGNHGTQVSSMIGSVGNNSVGITGVNWDVGLMQVTVGNLNEANVIEAYSYPFTLRQTYNETGGEKGAFVVVTNASWGIDGGDPADSPLWCEYYDTLGEIGILNCGATANNNVNIDVVGDLPTGCSSDYMVSVTATNDNDVRTFSGYGATTIDLGAPGEDVYLASNNNNYGGTSGTSFASPCVAGAIALLYSADCPGFAAVATADPQLGADMIRSYIMDGVDEVDNLEGECVTGGRLNVMNSLQILLDDCPEGGCLAPFAVSIADVDGGEINIDWNGLDEVNDFAVRYREVGAADWISIDGIVETEYTLNDLPWCTEFEIQLSSYCSEEDSEWTNSYFHTTDGCCVAPTAEEIVITDIQENSISLEWNEILAAQSFNVEYRSLGSTDWIEIESDASTQMIISNLEICTDYEIRINMICAVEENTSETIIRKTVGCGACLDQEYCEITSDDSSEEWIESVQIGTLVNTSGENGGYAEFSDLGWTLNEGSTYDIVLTPGYEEDSYNEWWVIWIDFNQNGDFENNEEVYNSDGGEEFEISGSMSIPNGVMGENIKMRVAMKYVGNFGASPPEPCDEFSYGESEDYCITIEGPVGISEFQNSNVTIFPNPTAGELTFSLKDVNINQIEIYDSSMRLVKSEQANSELKQMDLSDLAKGFYQYQLSLENGQIAFGTFIKK